MFDLIPFAAKSRDLFDSFDRRFWNDGAAALGDFRTDITEEGDKYVLEAELPGFKGNIYYAGDCAGERPSDISHATKSAYDVACSI